MNKAPIKTHAKQLTVVDHYGWFKPSISMGGLRHCFANIIHAYLILNTHKFAVYLHVLFIGENEACFCW